VKRAAILALALACQGTKAPAPSAIGGEPPLPGIDAPDRALGDRLAAAAAAFGPAAPYTNRLALEASPYLRQHAHNPVDWYAWGDDAFARARREKKPIFLSIGYATCHWCHVMEQVDFEDVEVATYINQHFVAIKVDREERPDVDDVYMKAVLLMTGSGGWPMTIIATPDGKPFFGGSYLPKAQLLAALHQLADAYAAHPDEVASDAREISARVGALADAAPSLGGVPSTSALTAAAQRIASRFDAAHGGFGGAPKFPDVPALALLLRASHRTGDAQALSIVTQTLDAMAAGGIHDQIGGGFHRYAVDDAWTTPHFEKMLDDNAQLAVLYTEAWQATGRAAYRDTAIETLDFLERELGDPGGGFYAAFDADSADASGALVEGAYYTWSYDELAAAVGAADAPAVAAHFGVASAGRAVLRDAAPVAPDVLARGKAAMAAARAKRRPPPRDDQIVAAWNGLAISAFARAGFAFDRPDYVERARRAAAFVLGTMRDEHGRLRRSVAAGRAAGMGGLDDHALVIAGLLDLFEATADPRWLAEARRLAGELDVDFAADGGGYYATATDAPALLARARPVEDGPVPSGNAVAALDLLRLTALGEDAAMTDRADRILGAFGGAMATAPAATAGLWAALDLDRADALEVTIVRGDDAPDALVAVVRKTYLPARALVLPITADQVDALAQAVPFVGGKLARGGKSTAYVCHHTRCDAPTSDPSALAQQLAPRAP
jgi:uncharacterized protein YyaL (SSP411 family)